MFMIDNNTKKEGKRKTHSSIDLKFQQESRLGNSTATVIKNVEIGEIQSLQTPEHK